jgi:hypothetical protein
VLIPAVRRRRTLPATERVMIDLGKISAGIDGPTYGHQPIRPRPKPPIGHCKKVVGRKRGSFGHKVSFGLRREISVAASMAMTASLAGLPPHLTTGKVSSASHTAVLSEPSQALSYSQAGMRESYMLTTPHGDTTRRCHRTSCCRNEADHDVAQSSSSTTPLSPPPPSPRPLSPLHRRRCDGITLLMWLVHL